VAATPRPRFAPLVTAVFTAAVLLSAALLFVVQPMVARMVLPLLGGTPATWTTCLLFFQVVLLVGYLYVHLSVSHLGPRAQAVVHLALLALVIGGAPLAAPPATGPVAAPVAWLLTTLATSVGLPFLAVSGTAPLLQRWYVQAAGRDPYFLYAASNAGSLVGLLGYPFAVEPSLTLAGQRAAWSAGFLVLTGLIAACAATAWPQTGAAPASVATAPLPPLTTRDRLWWLALAFVPASLLLGVTTHISTDVAAVPLLWVVPLAIYLLTFTAAFAAPPPIARRWPARLAAPAIAAAVAALVLGTGWRAGLLLHLSAFAVLATAFHRELADRRPPAGQLTQFFLIVSLGGALGGLFNALVAPRAFTDVVEYPLVLALAAALRPAPDWRAGRVEPAPLVLGLPVVVFAVVAAVWSLGLAAPAGLGASITGYWLLAALVLSIANRRAAFALAVAAVVAADLALPTLRDGQVIYAARSFFGVHRVVAAAGGSVHQLMHGTTLHGVERVAASGCEPTSYYHPDGPIGQLFRGRRIAAQTAAVIGLGAGGLACYQPAGATWTFLEIDPLVERIARDPTLFTFLARAPGTVRVAIGDGRQGLAAIGAGTLDLVIVDAFSSDAVPVHLLTREFVGLALARLRPDGVAVFHISNRYLRLGPVVARAAAGLGAAAVEQAAAPAAATAVASHWMVVGPPDAVARIGEDARWRPAVPGPRLWTDDYSNILDVLTPP
jgi:hypothetical protein